MADVENPTPTDQEERTPHAGGRPLKFESAKELEAAINKYFALCDPHVEKQQRQIAEDNKGNPIFGVVDVLTGQKPYTMSGLARAIGLTRQSLLNYKNRDEFFDSIANAKQRCEEYWEGRLDSPYSNGAKFNLSNNFQDEYRPWADKQVLAGDPDAPLSNPYAGLTTEQLRKLAEDGSDGADSSDTA